MAALVDEATAGDPITGLRWTRKTLRKLSRELKRRGFTVSPTTVRRLLQAQAYTLRVNRKRLSNQTDPPRDQQMRYIARQRRAFLQQGAPVMSVDTKKKELVGPFRNAGRPWRQPPLAVLATDFPSDAAGKAIPLWDLRPAAQCWLCRRWHLARNSRVCRGRPSLLVDTAGPPALCRPPPPAD